jgi:hypothetical protein
MARNSKMTKWLTLGCCVASISLVAWGVVSHGNSTCESQWASGLFVPLVPAHLLSLFILWQRKVNSTYYKFYLTSTTLGILSVSSMWILYSNKKTVEGFSYLAFTEIIVLLTVVTIMTAATMMSPKGIKPDSLARRFENLRSGVAEQPAWTLMLFVILFLSVGYLFGFAMAFHDQNHLAKANGVPALRMLNLKSPDDDISGCADDKREANLPVTSQSPTESSKSIDKIDMGGGLFEPQGAEFYFYFNKADAYVSKEEAACVKGPPPSRMTRDLSKPAQFNYCHLLALIRQVDGETRDGNRVRITLIGHSDNDQPLPNVKKYESNYELSQARAQNVRYEVLNQVKDAERWHNIEWLIIPASDEAIPEMFHGVNEEEVLNKSGINPKPKKGETQEKTTIQRLRTKSITLSQIALGLPPSEKRLVVASVKPVKDHITSRQVSQIDQKSFRPMKLLDYMYFSIYTITTTGYGDVVPTTPYAKFLSTFANICEVLFLVVFFNSLLSSKDGPPRTPTQRSAGGRRKQGDSETPPQNASSFPRAAGQGATGSK